MTEQEKRARSESNASFLAYEKETAWLSPEMIKNSIEAIPASSDSILLEWWKMANADLDSLSKKYYFVSYRNSKPARGYKNSIQYVVKYAVMLSKYPEIKSALEKEVKQRGLLSAKKTNIITRKI